MGKKLKSIATWCEISTGFHFIDKIFTFRLYEPNIFWFVRMHSGLYFYIEKEKERKELSIRFAVNIQKSVEKLTSGNFVLNCGESKISKCSSYQIRQFDVGKIEFEFF